MFEYVFAGERRGLAISDGEFTVNWGLSRHRKGPWELHSKARDKGVSAIEISMPK